LETLYLRLRRPAGLADLLELYGQAYRDSPFIRLPQRVHPEAAAPQLSTVQRTNCCDIHFVLGADGKRLVIVSCIDNLVKGAAGQAIQNMNLMLGLEETEGLL
jgi:N-acetyl-gamma-glutamyl-phosphate reductase